MTTSLFTEAVDSALAQEMADNPAIVVFGEDVPLLRRELLVRFGPERVRGTPISESAFVGAAVAAAMSGLRPVVEMYMVDFLGVWMDALLNHAAKVEALSDGRWKAPVVVRAPCGGRGATSSSKPWASESIGLSRRRSRLLTRGSRWPYST